MTERESLLNVNGSLISGNGKSFGNGKRHRLEWIRMKVEHWRIQIRILLMRDDDVNKIRNDAPLTRKVSAVGK